MKTYLDCIPCFLRQALFASRVATDDEIKIKEVLDRVGMLIKGIPMTSTPPETGRHVYAAVREITGVEDPFHDLKQKSTKKALELYPALKEITASAQDPLDTAVRLSIAGNIIDFGANPDFDIEKTIQQVLHQKPGVYHIKELKEKMAEADEIVFLGDNAGETVFDRVLIETMHKRVTYAVRARPIINDATMADAEQSGIKETAKVVSSGCDAPGTILGRCSEEFKALYRRADLIISKGQGNFETLSQEKGPIFYLLKVKCPVIARHLEVSEGDIIVKGPSNQK